MTGNGEAAISGVGRDALVKYLNRVAGILLNGRWEKDRKAVVGCFNKVDELVMIANAVNGQVVLQIEDDLVVG